MESVMIACFLAPSATVVRRTMGERGAAINHFMDRRARWIVDGEAKRMAMRSLTSAGTALSLVLTAGVSTAVRAETPREIATVAAFQTPDKAKALALIGRAIASADAILQARPGDREATLQRGVGIGYRAKLTRSRTDAKASLGIFRSLAAKDPRDPEA